MLYGRQADISWLHLSRKQNPFKTEVGALPTPSANQQLNGGGMDNIVQAIIHAIFLHVILHALFSGLIHSNSAQRRLERSARRVQESATTERRAQDFDSAGR